MSNDIAYVAESVRKAVTRLVTTAIAGMGNTDATVFLLPLLESVLKFDLTGAQLSGELLELALAGE